MPQPARRVDTEATHLKPQRFIAIEGPIGVGKTTLVRRLADSLNHQPVLENAEQNPFLERFYRDTRQNALAAQLFFLFQRAQQTHELKQGDLFSPAWVTDFLIAKDRLFAKLNLDANEYALYEKVYQQLSIEAPTPDLVVYLQAPTDVLLQRIQQRGVRYEQNIERSYLEKINAAYSEFFLYYDDAPLLIVNASQLDLAHDKRDYDQLVNYLLTIHSGRHYFNPSLI